MIAWRLDSTTWEPMGPGTTLTATYQPQLHGSTSKHLHLNKWSQLSKPPAPRGGRSCVIFMKISLHYGLWKTTLDLVHSGFNSIANLITLKSDVHDIILASNNSIFCIVHRVHCVTPIKAILIQNRKPAQTPVQWASNYTICFVV